MQNMQAQKVNMNCAEYVEMSPPPSSNKTRQALPANGHCKVTTDGDGELVANGKSRSRDSLELLEEDSPPRKSSAPPPEESNNDSRTSSDAVKPLQKRLSLSVLRGWKGIRNKVSGSRRRSDAGIPRERSGTRVEKKKLPLDNIRNPEISGYLRKRDKKLGRWQRRWCLVKGDRFLYAEKDTDRHTSDAFSMKGYRVMTGEHATYKMQHVIELVHSILPSYQFAASSTEEMDKWLSVLERASGLMDDGYEIPKEFDSETLARLLYDREQAELAKDPLSPPPLPGEESVSSPEVVKSSPRLFEAIFDFEGGEDDEIPFKKGDLLLIEDGGNDHWLIGSVQTKDEVFPGIKGFVPKSYLQPVTTNSDDRH